MLQNGLLIQPLTDYFIDAGDWGRRSKRSSHQILYGSQDRNDIQEDMATRFGKLTTRQRNLQGLTRHRGDVDTVETSRQLATRRIVGILLTHRKHLSVLKKLGKNIRDIHSRADAYKKKRHHHTIPSRRRTGGGGGQEETSHTECDSHTRAYRSKKKKSDAQEQREKRKTHTSKTRSFLGQFSVDGDAMAPVSRLYQNYLEHAPFVQAVLLRQRAKSYGA